MEMTASLRKFVASLSSARKRREEGAFIAEGTKCVCDTLGYFNLRYILATVSWFEKHSSLSSRWKNKDVVVSRKDLERMSSLSTAADVMAVYDMPVYDFDAAVAERELVIALDGVQDPGNVGTIIRAADWFGVKHIIMSEDCADAYGPKAIMATMGAISRVRISRGNLKEFIKGISSDIYGTFLDGDNIYSTDLSPTGLIVMGSEGNGISMEIAEAVNKRIFIPPYPAGAVTSESLNVGMATSIVLSEFRRRQIMN